MPIAAKVKINGVAGTAADLPINTIVALSNNNNTGVTTWLWAIADQPDGPADTLSSTVIAAPQFTPKKEGTYLIHLTVGDGTGNTETDQVGAVVLLLKTRARIPAQTETTEVSASEGWHPAVAAQLKALNDVRADPGLFVGGLGVGGMSVGQICMVTGTETIKSGLPGEESVPSLEPALANVAANVSGALAMLVGSVDGGALVDLAYFRWQGLVLGNAGAPAVSDPVYVSDTAAISLTPGTNQRQIGTVGRSGGGTYDFFMQGGGPAGAETLAAYLLNDVVPSSLPNAINVTDMTTLLELVVKTATNNAPNAVLQLITKVTGGGGVGANGIGAVLGFSAPNSTGAITEGSSIVGVFDDVTSGSEDGSIEFWTSNNGAFAKVAKLFSDGRLDVTTPTAPTNAATKAYADALPRQSQMMIFGGQDMNGQGAPDSFLFPGFGLAVNQLTEIKVPTPVAGSVTGFFVRARVGNTTAGANPVETFTVRKNGVNTSLVVTLNAGVTSGSDTTGAHAFTVAAGDDVSIAYHATAGIMTSSLDLTATLAFAPV